MAEATIRRYGQFFGRNVPQAAPNAVGNICNGFDVVVFHIDDAHGYVHFFGEKCQQFDFSKLTVGHFDVDFVYAQIQEIGHHRFDAAVTDRATFEIAKTHVGRKAAFALYRFYGTVENIDKAFGIFFVSVAAHRRFIYSYLGATCCNQVFQLFAHNRQQGFGNGIAVCILRIGQHAPAEGVRPRNTGFEGWASRGQFLEAQKLAYSTQTLGSGKWGNDAVFAALVVCGRAKFTGFGFVGFNPPEVTVKGKVEVEAGLFAIGNHVQTCSDLIVYRSNDGVFDHFFNVYRAKFFQMVGCKFQPAREWITAHYIGANRYRLHELMVFLILGVKYNFSTFWSYLFQFYLLRFLFEHDCALGGDQHPFLIHIVQGFVLSRYHEWLMHPGFAQSTFKKIRAWKIREGPDGGAGFGQKAQESHAVKVGKQGNLMPIRAYSSSSDHSFGEQKAVAQDGGIIARLCWQNIVLGVIIASSNPVFGKNMQRIPKPEKAFSIKIPLRKLRRKGALVGIPKKNGVDFLGTGYISKYAEIGTPIEVVAHVADVQTPRGVGTDVFPVAALDTRERNALNCFALSIGEDQSRPIATVVVPPNAVGRHDLQAGNLD